MSVIDKTPLRSKKFIAFFFSVLVIAGVIVATLLTQTFGWAMAAFMSVLALGLTAIAIGYVISQSALDKFVQGAARLSGSIKNGIVPNDDVE
jgi:uncharacterized membrane protein YraQ (UPF0718 family)